MSEGMGVFQRLRALFSRGAGVKDPNVLIFHVRCDRCGELTRARADRRWDLLQELGDGVTGYILHKEVLGMQCTALMRIHVTFDRSYKITNQEIEGGRFASQTEYEASQPAHSPRSLR